MSLMLNVDTEPKGLSTSVFPDGRTTTVHVGNYEIGINDFLMLAQYALTNTDLQPDDPRLAFIEACKQAKVVKGYSYGKQHLNVPYPKGEHDFAVKFE